MTSLLPDESGPVVAVPCSLIHGTNTSYMAKPVSMASPMYDLPDNSSSNDTGKLNGFPPMRWFEMEVKEALITINHKLDRLTQELHQHTEVRHWLSKTDAHPCINLSPDPVLRQSNSLFKLSTPMPQPSDAALLSDLPPCPPAPYSSTESNTCVRASQPTLVASRSGSSNADMTNGINESNNTYFRTNFNSSRSLSSRLSKVRTQEFDIETLRRIRSRGRVTATVWELLEEPELVPGGKCYAFTITITIIASALFSLAQTMERSPINGIFPAVLEVMFELAFSMEIVIRFFACPSKTVFFSIVYNWIDITASIVALSLRLAAGFIRPENWQANIAWTALLGLVPILRLLKLSRRFEQFHLLSKAFKQALEALPVLLYTLCILVLTSALMIFLVEPESNVPSLPSAVWLTIVTATTVGYGDMVPKSNLGKLVVSLLTITSALYMAMPIGIVGSSFSAVWADRDRLVLVHRTKAKLRQAGYSAKDVPHLFRLFDADQDGHLNYKEFRRMIREMRIGISEARTVELFQTFDADGSGYIDEEEFVKFLFPTTFTQSFLDSVSESICESQ